MLVFLIVQLSGCGLFFAKTDFFKATSAGKLKVGQSSEQVRTLLGNPDSTKGAVAGGVPVDMWIYHQTSHDDRSNYIATTLVTLGLWGVVPVQSTESHYIVFAGDKVVSWDSMPNNVQLPPQFSEEQPTGGRITSGTGFSIGHGYFLTNNHVIAMMPNPMIYDQGEAHAVTVAMRDQANDIALLKLSNPASLKGRIGQAKGLQLGDASKVRQGDRVWTLGFPLSSMLGEKPILTEGSISSTYGMGEDPRLFQISVPIQPGNSGGPLLNERGEVIGLTVSTINAGRIFQVTGAIPQNINFAVKINYVWSLVAVLPQADQPPEPSPSSIPAVLSLSSLVEVAKPHVVLIKGAQ
jgi:S1-C subfamily serine protease